MKSILHQQLAGNRKLLGSTDNGLTTQQKSMRLLWIVLCRLAHVKLGRLLPQSETETIVAQIPPRPTSKDLWGCWPKRGHDVGTRSLYLQSGRCRGGGVARPLQPAAQLAADILFGHYCNGPVPPKPCPQAVLLLQGSRSGWLWCRACCLLTCHFWISQISGCEPKTRGNVRTPYFGAGAQSVVPQHGVRSLISTGP